MTRHDKPQGTSTTRVTQSNMRESINTAGAYVRYTQLGSAPVTWPGYKTASRGSQPTDHRSHTAHRAGHSSLSLSPDTSARHTTSRHTQNERSEYARRWPTSRHTDRHAHRRHSSVEGSHARPSQPAEPSAACRSCIPTEIHSPRDVST